MSRAVKMSCTKGPYLTNKIQILEILRRAIISLIKLLTEQIIVEHITTIEAAEAAALKLSNEKCIALDTEFVRRVSSSFELCLIQIATLNSIFIFDLDFSLSTNVDCIKPILLNTKVLKVIHAAAQDSEILEIVLGSKVRPIFDTQIAFMFLGQNETVSYSTAIKDIFKVDLDKSQQMTNWKIRPLTQEQLNYAAKDVEYLLALHDDLRKKLIQKARLSWFSSYMRELTSSTSLHGLDSYQKFISKNTLNFKKDEDYRKLKLLIAFLDFKASSLNLIRSNLVPNFCLEHFVKMKKPTKASIYRVLQGHKHKLKGETLKEIIEFLKKDLPERVPEENSFRFPEYEKIVLSYDESHIFILLKVLLKKTSAKANIASRVVAEKHDLINLIRGNRIKFERGWRKKIFGQAAFDFLAGKIGFYCNAEFLEFKNIKS